MSTREEILGIIEKNSRIDVHELSVLLGADELLVANELKNLEEEGIICGYHTMIDWEKTSIEKVTALIEVRITPTRGQGFDNLAERIYRYRLEYIKDTANHPRLIEEHARIMDCVINKDVDSACIAAEIHIVNQENVMLKGPESFQGKLSGT